MEQPYRVGCLESPQDDDARYADEANAEAAAIALSFCDSVVAVWYTEENGEDEIVSLVWQQVIYSP